MRLRHVRALAVFTVAVIALTGARRHHGGGCSSRHSGSSSSSSGGSHYGSGTSGGSSGDDSTPPPYYGSSGSTSSGSGHRHTPRPTGTSTGGGPSGGTTDDVTVTSCRYDRARGVVARLSAHNRSVSTTYTYTVSVTLKDPDGAVVATRAATVSRVRPGATATQDVSAAYTPGPGGSTSAVGCDLAAQTRTAR